MSRGAAARRRRQDRETWLAVCDGVEDDGEEPRAECERLRGEVARLRDQLADVEGWYRLLQADHATLQANERRTSQRTTELQAESNRLEIENQELHAAVSMIGAADQETRETGDAPTMTRFVRILQRVRDHKWAVAALLTFATLVAREPAVRGVVGNVVSRVRQATESDENRSRSAADSGFVRYAAMLNSRDQAERARAEYNANEAKLKGDALLEAQDRLRAAKARYRQARLAFLPELARTCEHAGVPLPRDAAEALAALKAETDE
jgi:hypothetical protein